MRVRLQTAMGVPAAELGGRAGGGRTAAGAVGAPGWPTADLAEVSGVGGLGVPEPREARPEGSGTRTTGQPGVAPFSLPPRSGRLGCGRTHLPAGGGGLGWGCGTAKFAASSGGLLRVHGSVPQLQPRLRRGLRGREQRLGPQDARKRAPGGRAPHKTPFLYPRPRPALPRVCPRPRAGNAGGSGRSRDPLPSLRRFPAAAAARARTREVGQRPGDKKPMTWSREGGRAEGAGRERSPS